MAGNALIQRMAEQAGVTEKQYYDTLMATIMPGKVTNEQFLSFLQVAGKYQLNPLTKEIYAFPAKGGGIQPVVSIDGWMKLANSNPAFDGLEHEDITNDQGELVAITCRVHRKDREHPVTATEYMDECRRSTEPWKNWPRRMLRHKATIQAIRYAFGFAGIVDPDEAERWHDAPSQDVSDTKRATADRAQEIKDQLAAARGSGSLSSSAADPNRAAAPSPQPSDGPDTSADVEAGLSLGPEDVSYEEGER
jgi:phage recombination protein Bet